MYPLIALFTLKVAAVTVAFTTETNALDTSDTAQAASAARQVTESNSYIMEIEQNASRLVDSHLESRSVKDDTERLSNAPTEVKINCSVGWQTIEAVLQTLDDACGKHTLDSGINSWNDITAVYNALQICSPIYANRLWEAVCASPQFKDTLAAPVARLQCWADLFCDMPMPNPAPVPDCYWLDSLRDASNAKEDLSLSNGTLFMNFIIAQKTRSNDNAWLNKNASPLIKAIVEFVISDARGLILPHTLFLKSAPLAGRFGDIVDLILPPSNITRFIFSGPLSKVIRDKDDLHEMYLEHVDKQAPVCVIKDGHVSVCTHHSIASTPKWVNEVLTELLPGRITHLFLNIPTAGKEFWSQPIGGAESILSAIKAQPLKALAIYCRSYTPEFAKTLVATELPPLGLFIFVERTEDSDWAVPESEEFITVSYSPALCPECEGTDALCFDLFKLPLGNVLCDVTVPDIFECEQY